jgi:hypothetical protein
MARTLAALPEGSRITDYISLGVITKTFPLKRVRAVLAATGKASQRERDLPAHVVVYYAIALALYMHSSYREVLRALLEGVQWLLDPSVAVKVVGNSGISQARTRLGWEPLRQLHDELVKPIAVRSSRGAWYRAWRLVSLDGSTLEVADEQANEAAFGRPGASRGASAFPQIRFVSLVENGTHVLFGTQMGAYRTSEIKLAKAVLGALHQGMLCLADRGLSGFELWQQGLGTGAELLWRVRQISRLSCDQRLADGSYLSRIYPSEKDRRNQTHGRTLRVIETVSTASPTQNRSTAWSRAFWMRRAPPPKNWPRSTTSAGRLRRRLMSLRLICVAPRSSCAVRPRTWCARSSMDC